MEATALDGRRFGERKDGNMLYVGVMIYTAVVAAVIVIAMIHLWGDDDHDRH